MVDDARRILEHLNRFRLSPPERRQMAWRDELRGCTEDELADLSCAGDVDAQELLRERLRDPGSLTPAVVRFLIAWFVNGPPKRLRSPKSNRKTPRQVSAPPMVSLARKYGDSSHELVPLRYQRSSDRGTP